MNTAETHRVPASALPPFYSSRLIAIGASTGGPQAIEYLLKQLGDRTAPILITQHMPGIFTRAFARRLDETNALSVKEAETGDALTIGRVLIAPGGLQMAVRRGPVGFVTEISDGPPVNRHKPSVDFLFESVVAAAPSAALGILLTGMGNDGAQGLLAMQDAGYSTIAQNEATSTVWGMPREAVKLGAVTESGILSLEEIALAIKNFAAQKDD